MYHFNPLLLTESNVKSFQKLVSNISKASDPNRLKKLTNLRKDVLKSLPKQKSLPGFEIRGEQKLKIVDKAIDRLKSLRNTKGVIKTGLKYNPDLVKNFSRG